MTSNGEVTLFISNSFHRAARLMMKACPVCSYLCDTLRMVCALFIVVAGFSALLVGMENTPAVPGVE